MRIVVEIGSELSNESRTREVEASLSGFEAPAAAAPATTIRRRCQLNLSSDAEAKLAGLVGALSDEGNGIRVNRNEIVMGLIHALYEARGRLDIAAVPARGRWGGASAKGFSGVLGQIFSAAIGARTRR